MNLKYKQQGAVFSDTLGWTTLLSLFRSPGPTVGPSGAKIWPFWGQVGQIAHTYHVEQNGVPQSQRSHEGSTESF